MSDEHFIRFWETTLAPATPEKVKTKWREHELSAIKRSETLVEPLAQLVPIAGQGILDLGCGYGGFSVALARAGASVLGVDIDPQRLFGAKLRVTYDYPDCDVRLARASGEEVSLRTASFDAVVCNDVLEHVYNHTKTVSEIGRILKSGGWAFLTFPNRFSPYNVRHDPHYGLFGVSVLPPRLGAWYVVSLRKRSASYAVGTFPVASRVIRMLNRFGMEVIDWWPAPKRQLGWLTALLRLYRLNTQPLINLICKKTS